MAETIESLIEHYNVSPEVQANLKPIPTVILTGITGAGKDTIISDILPQSTDFEKVITSTTRQPRANNGIMEQQGREYYFLTYEEATQKIINGEYVEVAPVHERINGSLVTEYERIAGLGKIALTQIDYQGAAKFLTYGMNDLTVYFVTPPNFEIYMARLLKRQGGVIGDHQEIIRRFRSGQKELQYALDHPEFVPILNDSSQETAQKIISYSKEGAGPTEAERTQTYAVIKELGRSISAYISQIED